MNEIAIVFPHQLFRDHPALSKGYPACIVEEHLFFNQYNFHKQKLVLHRASMKAYEGYLIKKNFTVEYIDAADELADIRKLVAHFHKRKITSIHVAAVTDNWLSRRLIAACKKASIKLVKYRTPAFLNSMDEVKPFFDAQGTYFQTSFYIDQRKKRKLLLDANNKAEGGKWSFDADNRLKFPAKAKAPKLAFPPKNKFVQEAIAYVEKHFAENYGSLESFFYPVTFSGADKWLDEFLLHRFRDFGKYEDAIVDKEHFLHHSVLSPLLNTGLLLPEDVIRKSLEAAATQQVPLNSLEGFIRQLTGWREFIRIVYEREGSRQRTKNYWGFTRKIPASFWTGDTGIPPIDSLIKKILATGYCHHIERLMMLGSFMLLCEFDPDDVYLWFMEMFIDSYDWVMVPNVYGMTQFADGGLMTTKPYISGSNYILKMSDHKKGEWCKTWDGLFWRFMDVHRSFFSRNPRLEMLVKNFDKMDAAKKQEHHRNAEAFLKGLDG